MFTARDQTPNQPRAIIVVPDDGHAADQAALCTAYCNRRGYRMAGVVVGTAPEQWAAVDRMVRQQRQADIVVVPTREVRPEPIDMESVTQEIHTPPDLGLRADPCMTTHRVQRQRPRFLR